MIQGRNNTLSKPCNFSVKQGRMKTEKRHKQSKMESQKVAYSKNKKKTQ